MEGLMRVIKEAVHGRRVFVSGHTGFKGSWLCLWLHRLGAKVYGYSLDVPTNPSFFTVTKISSLLEADVRGDVRDHASLARAISGAAPDIVFHLAAQALVAEGWRAPVTTIETNVLGTAHLLEALRERNRPCAVVVVTSDKCYDTSVNGEAYCEGAPLGGGDPYSASKACAELLTAAYRKSFLRGTGIRVATARAGNVIGGGDWAAYRIVPDAIRALSRGQPVPVRNPDAVRPWQHVLEPLSGYLLLAARLLDAGGERWADAWNFGPRREDEVPVWQLVELICQAWGGGSWRRDKELVGVKENKILRLNASKAERLLGWRAVWSLQRAVFETVRWYKAYYSGASDLEKMAEDTIANYEHSAVHSEVKGLLSNHG